MSFRVSQLRAFDEDHSVVSRFFDSPTFVHWRVGCHVPRIRSGREQPRAAPFTLSNHVVSDSGAFIFRPNNQAFRCSIANYSFKMPMRSYHCHVLSYVSVSYCVAQSLHTGTGASPPDLVRHHIDDSKRSIHFPHSEQYRNFLPCGSGRLNRCQVTYPI
jgi:hypothetical protein